VKFVDQCDVSVVAGKGGNGSVAFRREKFVPFGGPSGGDGGNGGDVVFLADPGLSTLLDITYAHTLRAPHGQHGMGKDCYGKGGEALVCRVPVGTQVFTQDTHELLFDMNEPHMRIVVAKGGKGGRGNMHFATPYDRAPRRAEAGLLGEEKQLRLELKVMADVGLLGFPNVGKSTFIRACSAAHPKVADYPFTTLVPHLGVVRIDDDASFVLADIPGLIPGAAEGAGLGIRFLQHVERTRALLHLVTLDYGDDRDPVKDYDALVAELRKFDERLASRPTIVAMTKADLPEVREAHARLKPIFAKKKVDLRLVSAATGEGMRPLLIDLFRLVRAQAADPEAEAARAPKRKATTATATATTTTTAKKKATATATTTATAAKKKAAAKKEKAKPPMKAKSTPAAKERAKAKAKAKVAAEAAPKARRAAETVAKKKLDKKTRGAKRATRQRRR
jgi:GTPase